MNHSEKIAPVAAAATALATLACCLPVGIAAAAATASLAAVVAGYRVWFLIASALLLVVGLVQLSRAQRQCSTRKRGSICDSGGFGGVLRSCGRGCARGWRQGCGVV